MSENGYIHYRQKLNLWGEAQSETLHHQRASNDEILCNFRFVGQYADEESGLYYNRFRYYSPETGQYVSSDPIGLLGGFNPYGYVFNPTGWIDPLGLSRNVPTFPTSRQARRDAMRQAGIPTSQQPISQSSNSSGREYTYQVPAVGGGTQIMSVQEQTMDSGHKESPHWEAGKVKIDDNGDIRMNKYDRPKLTNDKGKAYYDETSSTRLNQQNNKY